MPDLKGYTQMDGPEEATRESAWPEATLWPRKRGFGRKTRPYLDPWPRVSCVASSGPSIWVYPFRFGVPTLYFENSG